MAIVLCFLLIMGHWTSSVAELVEEDSDFGTDSIVYDTDSGLEWLKLTYSLNWSFNGIVAQFGPGVLFEGFPHATVEEVEGLFAAAGIPYINQWSDEADHIAKCEDFAILFGPTRYQGSYPESIGITGTPCFSAGRPVTSLPLQEAALYQK